MRNILIAGLLSVGSFAFGQEQESNNTKDLRIKANLLTLPISMINVGVEK